MDEGVSSLLYLMHCVLLNAIQGILYQEYNNARSSWEEEREKLTSCKNQLSAAREQDKVDNEM